MKPYELKWSGRELSADELRDTAGAARAIEQIKTESGIFENKNLYLVTNAIMSADIVGTPMDITSISHYTGIQRSSAYNTIHTMEDKKLLICYSVITDKRRRFAEPTELLINQYLTYLSKLSNIINFTANKSKK